MNEPNTTRLTGKSEVCPHCAADLVAGLITDPKTRQYYLPIPTGHKFGTLIPDDGRRLVYLKVIGQSSLLYDKVLAWTCPECGTTDIIPGYEEEYAREQEFLKTFEEDRARMAFDRDNPGDASTAQCHRDGITCGCLPDGK